jgi:predicted Abi (CAAX) family protease
MVKELEDAPRDETAVLLDGDAAAVVGLAPDNTFELQVQAAGSILKAHAARGRRAALIVNCASRAYQRVHSFDGDWLRALEMLAAVEPDGPTPVASMLADESGPAGRALELTVVTSSLTPRLAERLAQRVFQRHAATLVYIDPGSFAGTPAPQLDAGVAGQVLRLQRAGVPVAIVRRGDDLVSTLGAAPAGAAVG